MKNLKLLLLLFTILTFTSCKNSSDNSDDSKEVSTFTDGNETYPDGTYCAEVEYYNTNTGTRNTYTLNVEVENNQLTVIHWPNGGWLDNSHFSSQELNSDGSCSFSTYEGNQYDIHITGSECSYTDESQAVADEEESTCPECGLYKSDYDDLCYSCTRKLKCPECGGKKYRYDDVCYDCKRKAEDKEEHTCKRCGQYDSFMFSTDELCSDCEKDDKRREQEDNDN